MDGVGDFMAQSAGKLLYVLYEIEERIHHVHVAPGVCERVRLSFVDRSARRGLVRPP